MMGELERRGIEWYKEDWGQVGGSDGQIEKVREAQRQKQHF